MGQRGSACRYEFVSGYLILVSYKFVQEVLNFVFLSDAGVRNINTPDIFSILVPIQVLSSA